MPIQRRVPEVTADIANRLRQIDLWGQPSGAEAMEEAKHFVWYGWVNAKEWSLTPVGQKTLEQYHSQAAGFLNDREKAAELRRLTAR